jgi:hypothetical protein
MDIHRGISRNTLTNANKVRDWCTYADFAQALIKIARCLDVDGDFGVELSNTVYPLDATTVDLCLSMFPWANFQHTKAAVKLHTLLDLRGNIPTFIHISDGKLHYVNFVDPRQVQSPVPPALLPSGRQVDGLSLRPEHRAHGVRLRPTLSAAAQAYRVLPGGGRQDIGLPDQQLLSARLEHRRAVRLAGGAVLQVGQAAPAHQGVLRNLRERSRIPNVDRRLTPRVGGNHQETGSSGE